MAGRRLTIVASNWWERQNVLPGCHGWPTVMQCKSLCICFQPGAGVGGPHLLEGVQEAPAEVPDAGEALPELLVENAQVMNWGFRGGMRCSRWASQT